MGKFTNGERHIVKGIVASLTIKRVSDPDIIQAIQEHTNKTITRRSLYDLRHSIKRDSYGWYKTIREGEYEYIHEFKERIDEILSLQKKHHQIIDANEDNPQIQQASLAELHRLNITLSNYFDVAPSILSNATISTAPEVKSTTTKRNFIV